MLTTNEQASFQDVI